MAVSLSAAHPFPLDAVGFNSFDHDVDIAERTTPTGVNYAVLTYTPRNTPGFDYDRYFTYAGAPDGPIHFTVSFNATVAEARNVFLSSGAPDLTGELSAPGPLSAAEIVTARAALAEYMMYTNLVFTETSGGADIMFFHDERFGRNGFARNAFDRSNAAYELDNIVGFAAIGSANDPYMFVHELGHVLTLKHVGPIQTDSETPFLPAQYQDNKYSIMFYDVTNFEVIDPGERFTRHLQLFDVYALQQRFGANMTWNTGDDTYTADDFDGWRTVLWDAGGEDTLDFSAFDENQVMDLREGAFSTLGGFVSVSSPDNLSIAYGAEIEHARAGGGDDRLTGNALANRLVGEAGDDTLRGGGGQDSLFGGFGDDRADGEGGRDFIRTGPGNDTLIGGAANDTLGASNRTDLLRGGDGRDLLLGSNGNDRVFGDAGDDTLLGGNGRDTIEGGEGADRLVGGAGNDRMRGGPGDDTLIGGDGADRFAFFAGEAGDDEIIGFDAGGGAGDVIVLIGFGAAFDSFADVQAAATQAGADTIINLGAGATLTLVGVSPGDLTPDDFVFG